MENGFVCLDGESEGVVAGLAHAHWAPTRSVQMIHASVVPYPRPQLQNEEVKCTSRNTHKPVDTVKDCFYRWYTTVVTRS